MTSGDGRHLPTIETRGIEPVPDSDRHGGPAGLFWMWFGANMGILGITLGAILVSVRGLSVPQAVLVAVLGACGSFVLVGILSLIGQRGGAPGLTASRAVFGARGNWGPTLVSWLCFVGWETVMCTTAAYALLAVLQRLGGEPSTPATAGAVLFTVAVAGTIGLFGHATIMWIQKWLTWVFGGFTLVVLAFLVGHVRWEQAFAAPPAPAVDVVAGVGLIAAGTGVGWLAAGADYARYLPRSVPAGRIVGATVGGAGIPLVVLIVMGSLMAVGDRELASASDPVAAIGAALPDVMLVPYLLTAVAGLLAAADLSMYSSGLNLITGGIRVRRTTAVLVDAVLITVGGLYLTVVAQDFYGPFTTFLTLLAIPLMSWGALTLVDSLRRRTYDPQALLDRTPAGAYWYRGGVAWPAVGSWVAGIVAGSLFTSVVVRGEPVVTGPLAHTWVGANGLAWLVAGLVAAIGYVVTGRSARAGGAR